MTTTSDELTASGVLDSWKDWDKNYTLNIGGERYSQYGKCPSEVQALQGKQVTVKYKLNGKYKNLIPKDFITEVKDTAAKGEQKTLPQAAKPTQKAIPRGERVSEMAQALQDAKASWEEAFGKTTSTMKAPDDRAIQGVACTFYIQDRMDGRYAR